MEIGIATLAGRTQVRDLVRLYQGVWEHSTGIIDLLASEAECYLVTDNGTLCGYSFVEVDTKRGYGEIHDFAVAPGSRRKGLGRALMTDLQRRYEQLRLIADDTQEELKQFYTSMGFTEGQLIENYYDVGRDGRRMEWRRKEKHA